MSNHRIIVAESIPDYPAEPEEKFLNLPDVSEEEIIETEQQTPPAEKAEPLFSEIPEPEVLKQQLSSIDEETAAFVVSSTELFKTCVLPNKTELQERNLKTKSDILVGDHCNIGYGLYGNDIAICELSTMHGDVVAEGDLRIDNFCEVHGTVICNGDAYLGEGVKIHGKLTVGGNLDIGDNVTIDKEFKALGDIAIRNPMPVVLYLLLYVMTMLHLEGEESTKKKLNELVAEDGGVLSDLDGLCLDVSVQTAVGANLHWSRHREVAKVHGRLRRQDKRRCLCFGNQFVEFLLGGLLAFDVEHRHNIQQKIQHNRHGVANGDVA